MVRVYLKYFPIWLFFIELLVTQSWCELKPLPDELASRLSLAKCVGKASTMYFKPGEILLVSLPVYEVSINQSSATLLDRLLFRELFSLEHLSIVIKKATNSRRDENYQKSVDNYVVQVRAVPELTENLNALQTYSSWNPHAKFLIVSVTIYENNAIAAANIIEQLWNHKIANGIILLPNKNDTSVFDAYSWFPFKNGNCGTNFDKLNIVDRCRYGKIEVGRDWFSNKIPHNLNGCPIRVRTVVWPPYVLPPVKMPNSSHTFVDGLEILLINTMAEAANFSVVYSTSDTIQDWGYIYKNGTASGAMLYIKDEKADIAVSSFVASLETHLHFDIITYPIPESLKWCVPHAEFIPEWKYFFTVVRRETYFCIIFAYVAVSWCMWKLSIYKDNESTSYKCIFSSFQNVFATMLNVSVKTEPRSDILRVLFLVWIFFSLHVNVTYQTFLMSVFSKPQYQHQIETVEEVFQNNLQLWFLPTHKRFFMNSNDSITSNVVRKWKDCTDINKCLYATAFDRSSATCTPRLYLKYIGNSYVDKNGESLLYCFKSSIVTYPLEMILRKGFPFKEYFTNLVGRIDAAGLMVYWEKRIFEYIDKQDLGEIQNSSEKLFTISITHLILLFVVLGTGYILGFIILLLEIHHAKKNKRQLPFLH